MATLELIKNTATAAKAAPKKTAVRKPKFNFVERTLQDGNVILDFTGTKSGHHLSNDIISVLRGEIGYYEANRYIHRYPVNILARYWTQLEDMLDVEDDKTAARVKEIVSAFAVERRARIEHSVSLDQIEYDDIPYYFQKGDEVYGAIKGEYAAGIIEKVQQHQTMFSAYTSVSIRVIHYLTGEIAESEATLYIGAYSSFNKISQLPVLKLTPEIKLEMAERGRKFVDMFGHGRAQYAFYAGQLTRSSWYDTKSYRADGRVMVDTSTFRTMDSDQFRSEVRHSAVSVDDDRNEHSSVELVARPEDYWRVYPFTFAFSFKSKQWGTVAISGLSDVKWRDDSFDKLVLPAEQKELVKSLVEHHNGSFTDIVDDKGGGTIFLLHGPPGQGKTLTMETVAELLHKPLYLISVGELGTDPRQLESSLREILDVATAWDAVIGLDEADVFLEARDEHDIVRNAMVGVFLRLLEYHQGVLFLTTNRVKNIDSAFYSRISVALQYPAATSDKRLQIWTNLLDAAGVRGIDVATLGDHDLNGRQIKNIIRLSQTLARARNGDVTNGVLSEVIDLTTKFERDIGIAGK